MDNNTLYRLAIRRGATRLAQLLDNEELERTMDEKCVPRRYVGDAARDYADRKLSAGWARAARARSSKRQKDARKGR